MNPAKAITRGEAILVPSLNTHLSDAPFGPYDHVSQAVNELLRLRKKNGPKAAALEQALESFAVAHGSNLAALMQWPALVQMRR